MSKSQAGKIKAKILRLMKTAESGAQWAEICLLEAQLVNAGFKA